MATIGIETSGLEGSVALRLPDGRTCERRLDVAGRRHAQTLVAELQAVLQTAGLAPADVRLIAVSHGPGSFTGLRVGIVCAKTFAYATGCAVVAVDTLAAVAEAAPADVSALWVVSDAQRGDLFVGRYVRQQTGWERQGPIVLTAGAPWLATLAPGDVVAGPGVTRLPDATTVAICRGAWSIRPSAAAIAAIGARLSGAGHVDDLWKLAPLYIRPSAAEEKRQQQAAAT